MKSVRSSVPTDSLVVSLGDEELPTATVLNGNVYEGAKFAESSTVRVFGISIEQFADLMEQSKVLESVDLGSCKVTAVTHPTLGSCSLTSADSGACAIATRRPTLLMRVLNTATIL